LKRPAGDYKIAGDIGWVLANQTWRQRDKRRSDFRCRRSLFGY
jgi:hypothetical protein